MIAFEKGQSEATTKAGSDRAFGLVFAAVFAIAALWPLPKGGSPSWILAAPAAALLLVAIACPRILGPANRAWLRFGLLLHRIVTPVILAVIFFAVFVPIGLLLRLAGKDLLRLARSPGATTYWIARDPRQPQRGSMEKQF